MSRRDVFVRVRTWRCRAPFWRSFCAPQQDFSAEGLKALDANQPAAAELLLRKAVEADVNDFSAHFNLALALSLQQKDAEAIQELRRTLELKPGLYQADLNLGTLLLRNKRAAEAVPVLKEALQSAPNAGEQAARVNFLYAQALYETGDFAQSGQYYRAAAARAARPDKARHDRTRRQHTKTSPIRPTRHGHKPVYLNCG